VAAFLGGLRHRLVPGGVEAFGALRLAQLVGAELRLADGAGGAARGAGDGERGDEGALKLARPAVGARATRDGIEIEQVAEIGELILAGTAPGAAAVADDWDRHRHTPNGNGTFPTSEAGIGPLWRRWTRRQSRHELNS
jgi:hypothetical protein